MVNVGLTGDVSREREADASTDQDHVGKLESQRELVIKRRDEPGTESRAGYVKELVGLRLGCRGPI